MELRCDLSAVCAVLLDTDSTLRSLNWHFPHHVHTRELMKQCIKYLIMERRADAAKMWESRLTEIIAKVEEKLYYQATSIEVYSDPYTLVSRLQTVIDHLQSAGSKMNLTLEKTITQDSIKDVSDSLTTSSSASSSSSAAAYKPITTVIPPKPIAYDAVTVAPILFPQIHQVSSQGCSRVFIVKVLTSVAEFVKGRALPGVFTFKREMVQKWLAEAKADCRKPTFTSEESYYGGPPFIDSDNSTHWTEPSQLYTWWKNNIERRAKFKVLQEDSLYDGPDARRMQRAKWCQLIVALAEAIRASSSSQVRASQAAAEKALAEQKASAHHASVPYFIQPGNNQYLSSNPYGMSNSSNPYLSGVKEVGASSLQSEVKTAAIPVESSSPPAKKSEDNIFLTILFDLLTNGTDTAVISWSEDGHSIVVHDTAVFSSHVLPKYFQCLLTLSSFEEFLISFGFTINSPGVNYSHPLFHRGKPELIKEIKTINIYEKHGAAPQPLFPGAGPALDPRAHFVNYNMAAYMNPYANPYAYPMGAPTSSMPPPFVNPNAGFSPGYPGYSGLGYPYLPPSSLPFGGLSRYQGNKPYPISYNQMPLFQQQMNPQSRMFNPYVRGFPGRPRQHVNYQRRKEITAFPPVTNISAEQVLDGTLHRHSRSSRNDPTRVKRPYTKRSKETIENIRVAKAAKRQARLERKAAAAAASASGAPRPKRGRRPKRTYDSDLEEDGVDSESLASESDIDIPEPDGDAGDEDKDDQATKPRRSGRMLLKNSDKLRKPTPQPVKRKVVKEKVVVESNAPVAKVTSTKSLQSKQNSADGSIMPYRASYVTNSKSRSERMSSNNNLNQFFEDGVWTNYERIKPKVGADCQVAIPEMCTPITKEEFDAARENLMWSPYQMKDSKVTSYLQRINDSRSMKSVDIGGVLVVFIAEINSHRLCAVLDVYFDMDDENDDDDDESRNSNSEMNSTVRVFDGVDEWVIPLTDCNCHQSRYEDNALQYLGTSERGIDLSESDISHILAQDDDENLNSWSHAEVKLFCSEIKRCGDNARKIWKQNFEDTKTFLEVLDFFQRVYPQFQGDKKKLISIFHRAELASAGYPDGLDSGSSGGSSESENGNNSTDSEGEDGQGSDSDSDGEGSSGDGNDEDKDDSTSDPESGGAPTESVQSQSIDVNLLKRKGRPPKQIDAPEAVISHSLLVHAQKTQAAAAVKEQESERKSSRKRSVNPIYDSGEFDLNVNRVVNRKGKVVEEIEDEPAPAPAEELFCICRTIETDIERYIACSIGHPDRCNGWVHVSCAGLDPFITDEELHNITNFVCKLCAGSSSSSKKARGRKSINEKLELIEAFSSPTVVPSTGPTTTTTKSGRSSRSRY